ncbi:MAG: hypothetical protein QOI50_7489, partial [Pseudonocardiales bacterium]|nr:hypothetical protein [Pseudonocardiales bacterium]
MEPGGAAMGGINSPDVTQGPEEIG